MLLQKACRFPKRKHRLRACLDATSTTQQSSGFFHRIVPHAFGNDFFSHTIRLSHLLWKPLFKPVLIDRSFVFCHSQHIQMLSMSSPSSNGIKLEPFAPTASADSSAVPQSATDGMIAQQPISAVVPPTMNGNGAVAQIPPQPQLLPQLQQVKAPAPGQAVPKAPVTKSTPSAPATSNAAATTSGSVRSGNGGGGQLLQFPWKLHEMLHLAEKNGKTDIISWLPGGNGFKVHDKEKFCAEIMPGYFASQKYKTFQRSLNLWGFESVAKGPDRGACYHQYFVKGHPELCHNM